MRCRVSRFHTCTVAYSSLRRLGLSGRAFPPQTCLAGTRLMIFVMREELLHAFVLLAGACGRWAAHKRSLCTMIRVSASSHTAL